MAISSLDQWFDPLLLHRLLYRENITRGVTALKIVFALVTLITISVTAWLALSLLLSPPVELDELDQKVTDAIELIPSANSLQDTTIDFAKLAQTKMFGEAVKKDEKKTSTEKPKPVSNIALELIGTFLSADSSQAIIENKKKKEQDVFTVGQMIFDEAELVRILPNKVEIKRNGTIELLTIDDSLLGDDGPSGAAAEGEEEFVIDEEELNSALDNLPLLLTQARAVPYFKQGKAVGLRLFAIKNGSLYEKLGLKNGDILKSINDNSLADMNQAMKLFEKLREERSLRVVLERNKKESTHFYTIQ